MSLSDVTAPPSSAPGGPVASWIVCGVVFWVMALPAFYLIVLGVLSPRRR